MPERGMGTLDHHPNPPGVELLLGDVRCDCWDFRFLGGQPAPDEGEAVGYQGTARATKTAPLGTLAGAKAHGQSRAWSKKQRDDQGQSRSTPYSTSRPDPCEMDMGPQPKAAHPGASVRQDAPKPPCSPHPDLNPNSPK